MNKILAKEMIIFFIVQRKMKKNNKINEDKYK